MSENLLDDEHDEIKEFKCIECQLTLPESSRFQDKPVCVNCVAEAGYKAPTEIVDNQNKAQPEQHKDLEAKVSVNQSDKKKDKKEQKEPEVSVEAQNTEVLAAKAVDTIPIEKNIKNEKVMSISMVEEANWAEIAAGKFMMGSPDVAEDSEEQPHEVAVSAFKILKTAVSFEQFDVFCQETGRGKYSDCKWGRGNRPAVFVSYWDAVDYAKWLSDVTGWQCRLPTEAEWEFACRAGTATTYNTGNSLSTAQANYDGDTPHLMVSKGISRHKTMPTGTFPGNAWGVFEMHGNVYEWCASEYDPYYNGLEQEDGSTDRSNDVPRVLRGGSWNSRVEALRSAARKQGNPDQRSNEWGFRLVRTD